MKSREIKYKTRKTNQKILSKSIKSDFDYPIMHSLQFWDKFGEAIKATTPPDNINYALFAPKDIVRNPDGTPMILVQADQSTIDYGETGMSIKNIPTLPYITE